MKITAEEVYLKIKNKFGTINKFCRCANLNAYKLQILFTLERNWKYQGKSTKRLEELIKINGLIAFCNPEHDYKTITLLIREKIQIGIKKKGGIRKFCEKYPVFSPTSIYQILQGRRIFKTKKVKHLLRVLKII